MIKEYTREQLRSIYQKLPEELRDILGSLENTDQIIDITVQNGVEDDAQINTITKLVGYVLMGLILPQEFSGILETDIKLPKTLADAIARDINRLVFYPVKPALEQLHRMEIEVSAKIVTPKPEESEEEKPEEPRGEDPYREDL